MITTTAFEASFETFIKRVRQEKLQRLNLADQVGTNVNVFIDERKILVSAHNTWRNLGEQDSSLSLAPPNQNGVSVGNGILQISNYKAHPQIALIFRVQYKVTVPMVD